MSLFQKLPEPHSTVAGHNNPETSTFSLKKLARLWRPQNVIEPEVSTLARFAGRLIDRVTGKAYSADEFAQKLRDDGFVAPDDEGNIIVNGVAPRQVTAAEVDTDVPKAGEHISLPDHSNCTAIGDGESTVLELQWSGELTLNVDQAFATAHLSAGKVLIPYKADHVRAFITEDISGIATDLNLVASRISVILTIGQTNSLRLFSHYHRDSSNDGYPLLKDGHHYAAMEKFLDDGPDQTGLAMGLALNLEGYESV